MAQLSSWRDSVAVVVDDWVELLGMRPTLLPGIDPRSRVKVLALE
jgi:hypothetical protein